MNEFDPHRNYWLSPKGELIETRYGGHEGKARDIIDERYDDRTGHDPRIKFNCSISDGVDFLENLGWTRYECRPDGVKKWLIWNWNYLTEAQAKFLNSITL